MKLTQKPFKKLFKDKEDKDFQRFLYHLHRAIEYAHRFEKNYYRSSATIINERN